jgi:UDP-N-acetylmuramoyl-L-alanyl-D-glutamate--2,6-diaminopimelate ligase
VITYGRQDECHIRLREGSAGPNGLELDLKVPGGLLKLSSPILGAHNIENLLAAAALGWRLGFPTEAIQEGVASLESVPGRFQKISGPGEPTVLVDYAHTPAALERLLKSARDITAGRLILVFGCGGDRDRQKRPLMGRAAAQGADFTFITSDNPRGEPPEKIIGEIREGYLGVKDNGYQVVMDRREAIFLASDMSSPGDTVVIAGKGHEDYQLFSNRKVHFDDREIAREAFRRVRS